MRRRPDWRTMIGTARRKEATVPGEPFHEATVPGEPFYEATVPDGPFHEATGRRRPVGDT